MSQTAAVSEHVPDRAGGLSFRSVWLGLGGLFLAAGLAAVFGYFTFLRYERVASAHVPPDAVAAVRVDLERILIFEPLRAQGLPLLNELGPRNGALPSRLDRFRQASGIKFTLEVRELLWAGGPSSADWLLVIGGKFPAGKVVPAVQQIMAEDGWNWRAVGAYLESPSGYALGQAADGAIVLASSRSRLELALPAGKPWLDLGSQGEGAGGFFVRGPAPPGLQGLALTSVVPGLGSLLQFVSAAGTLDTSLALEVLLTFESASHRADAQRGLEQLQRSAASLGTLLGDGVPKVLERARVTPSGSEQLRVALTLDQGALEQLATTLARSVRSHAAGP